MSKNRKYCLSISGDDYNDAEAIIVRFYNRGDLDSVSVEHFAKDCKANVWVQCSTDDLEALKNELRENGIAVV